MSQAGQSTHEMLESPAFKRLVRHRWMVSVILTLLLFVIYYGYILLIGYNKPFMATKIGAVTTLGIPLGVGVIVLSWLLTVIYVIWANKVYDVEVKNLKSQLK
ncbi:MAG: DUF485 domain-containing protein [Verrucomicrobia bacterium]|nr:DUF485 domain-containing protein [Verrucomicrobiota bacterium]MCG2681224.1 DUF485 domain-containing protein [Kiritimatiellia bacterium]MBU4247335.1 DUF485 domain-containing protein [Verrucomicrobiota bacterium]MBU4289829.1 DUF485 domain-containing protein [Verrucomicrobiota bacterium]MBU4428843.1 DUF485 domain-containing protein [Verrucomicrobiota bacterium]